MIIAFGKDRLLLKLAAVEAEIEQIRQNIAIVASVPRVWSDGLVKRQGKAARIRKVLEMKGDAMLSERTKESGTPKEKPAE